MINNLLGFSFGLVRSIEQVEYGEETWSQMLEHVGFRNTVFTTHGIYPDSLMTNLAQAASVLIANGDSPADFTQFFGRCFVRYFSYHGYDKFIQVRPATTDRHPLPDARDGCFQMETLIIDAHWCRLWVTTLVGLWDLERPSEDVNGTRVFCWWQLWINSCLTTFSSLASATTLTGRGSQIKTTLEGCK